jgi:hypothetical protein
MQKQKKFKWLCLNKQAAAFFLPDYRFGVALQERYRDAID